MKRFCRLALAALIPAAAMSFGLSASLAQTPSPAPAASAPAPVQTADPFGQETTLEAKKVVMVKGTANWDSAFDTLIDAFKSLTALLDKQGIKPAGNPM